MRMPMGWAISLVAARGWSPGRRLTWQEVAIRGSNHTIHLEGSSTPPRPNYDSDVAVVTQMN